MSRNKMRIVKNIFSSILVVLIFFFCFISLVNISFYLLYIETPVKGFSMRPTLNINVTDPEADGDIIYINQYTEVNRNDIVVAKVDWHEDLIIKRVVGVPGDKIEIKDENTHYGLYVNDSLVYTKERNGVNEPFNKTGTNGYYGYYLAFLENEDYGPSGKNIIQSDESGKYIKLGEYDYFLMGDNWGQTTDSIFKGPEKASSFIGKVDLIVDVTNDNLFVQTWFFLKKLFS
ncbi:MAG: signal peptidase I [Clostridia bacterium]|nr:signal peptidase I [Clostridia bacterium]